MLARLLVGAALVLAAVGLGDPASAHRSGCHRWHSCPSDTGSYVCGDLGYSNYCGTGTTTAPKKAPKLPSVPTAPKTNMKPGAGVIRGMASVIDGDTIEVHGQRIRLHGMDAPESAQHCHRADGMSWACGREASFALADLIGRRPVQCVQRDLDRYGRAVAVCTVGDIDLSAWLVRRGYAIADRRYSLDYVDEEDTARTSKAGIWAGEFIPPWEWRRGRRLSDISSGADRDCGDFSGHGKRRKRSTRPLAPAIRTGWTGTMTG